MLKYYIGEKEMYYFRYERNKSAIFGDILHKSRLATWQVGSRRVIQPLPMNINLCKLRY